MATAHGKIRNSTKCNGLGYLDVEYLGYSILELGKNVVGRMLKGVMNVFSRASNSGQQAKVSGRLLYYQIQMI